MACLCIKAIITSCAVSSFIYAFGRDDNKNGQKIRCDMQYKAFFMVGSMVALLNECLICSLITLMIRKYNQNRIERNEVHIKSLNEWVI